MSQPAIEATLKKQSKKPADALRKPQLRILAALAKAKEPLTRAEIAKKANVDLAWIGAYTGSADKKVRAKNDKRHRTLLTRGFVKISDSDGVSTYSITAAGRKALAKGAKP